MSALEHFLTSCAAEISRRVPLTKATAEDRASMAEGAQAFARALGAATPVVRPSSSVPAAETLRIAPVSPLLTAALDAFDEIPWVPSWRLEDDGVDAGLAPLNEVREFGDIVCGLLVLRPDGVYPTHSHPPQELYLPVTGNGHWRYGGAEDFCMLEPDALVYNHPDDVHSIVAGDEPLLALYVLWP